MIVLTLRSNRLPYMAWERLSLRTINARLRAAEKIGTGNLVTYMVMVTRCDQSRQRGQNRYNAAPPDLFVTLKSIVGRMTYA